MDKCGACGGGLALRGVESIPALHECEGCGCFNRVPRRANQELIVSVGPCQPDVKEMRLTAEKYVPSLEKIDRYYEEFNGTKPRMLYDVAAGIGGLPWVARLRGYTWVGGCEVRPESCLAAQETYGVRLDNCVFEDAVLHQAVDVITCYHGIEHTLQPKATIQKAIERLNPGGILFLAHPCIPSKETIAKYADKSSGIGGHNYEWTYEAFNIFVSQFPQLETLFCMGGTEEDTTTDCPPTQEWVLRKK